MHVIQDIQFNAFVYHPIAICNLSVGEQCSLGDHVDPEKELYGFLFEYMHVHACGYFHVVTVNQF